MPNKLLPHSLEAGEICTYTLLLKDYIMQNMQSINSYPFLEPLLNRKFASRKRQWEISPSPLPSVPWYSVFILFSLVLFVLLAYWSSNRPLFHLYWNQLAEDKVHTVYLEPVFLRLLIIIFLLLSGEAASDLFSGSFHECLPSFTLNAGLFLSLPVPQNVDHMLALLCISVSEFVFLIFIRYLYWQPINTLN